MAAVVEHDFIKSRKVAPAQNAPYILAEVMVPFRSVLF